MKFGPLQYADAKGLYEEDPATTEMQVRMERALVAKAGREIRKRMSQAQWVFHSHGSSQHAMSLNVEFHVLTRGEIESIERAAAADERKRVKAEIVELLS